MKNIKTVKILEVLSVILVAIILGLFFYSWYRLHQILHLHVSLESSELTQSLPLQTATLHAADGQEISAWYLPVPHPKAVVILVHGFQTPAGGKAMMLVHAQYLRTAGYSSFLLDLRSEGQSPGNQVTLGYKEWRDVVAAYNYLRAQPENHDVKIGYLGLSMGASTSIIAAGEAQKGDFVIASVPFASYDRLFRYQIAQAGFSTPIFTPFMAAAARFELGWDYEHYSPLGEIKKIHVPVYIFQGERDQSVNPADPELLYQQANQPKAFWSTPTGHDIYQAEPAEFQQRVLEFLHTNL